MAPLLSRPEVISLAGGVPDPQTFPLPEIEEAVVGALRGSASEALQYGRTRGSPRLVGLLGAMLSHHAIAAPHERLFVTAGSQQALDLLGRLLLDAGDTVIVETPTYVGALAAFRAGGARLRALKSGGPDPDPEAVREAVGRAAAGGSRAKVLYLCPNFQNPSGTTLTLAARQRLLRAAIDLGLWVIEDDPYREIWFEQQPPPAMASLPGGECVIYLGSFSKVLAPGLRLGFAVVPEALCTPLDRLKEASDLCSSTLSQAVAAELLAAGLIEKRMPAVRELYRRRRDALLVAMAKAFPPEASWTHPGGGFFSWVRLPGLDAGDLLERALVDQVAFVAGAPFHAEGGGGDNFRLAFSKEPEERIALGVRRLGELMRGRAAGGPS